MWHSRHSGICLRCALIIIILISDTLGLRSFICLTWCISTRYLEPHFAQHMFSSFARDTWDANSDYSDYSDYSDSSDFMTGSGFTLNLFISVV